MLTWIKYENSVAGVQKMIPITINVSAARENLSLLEKP